MDQRGIKRTDCIPLIPSACLHRREEEHDPRRVRSEGFCVFLLSEEAAVWYYLIVPQSGIMDLRVCLFLIIWIREELNTMRVMLTF